MPASVLELCRHRGRGAAQRRGGRKEAEGCRENPGRSLVKEEAESERGRRALAAYSSFTHRETEREALLDVFHLEMSQTGT